MATTSAKIALPTLLRLRKMVAKKHSLALGDVGMTWTRKPRLVKCPTGVMGVFGSVMVSAPGFRTRAMHINADESGILLL